MTAGCFEQNLLFCQWGQRIMSVQAHNSRYHQPVTSFSHSSPMQERVWENMADICTAVVVQPTDAVSASLTGNQWQLHMSAVEFRQKLLLCRYIDDVVYAHTHGTCVDFSRVDLQQHTHPTHWNNICPSVQTRLPVVPAWGISLPPWAPHRPQSSSPRARGTVTKPGPQRPNVASLAAL